MAERLVERNGGNITVNVTDLVDDEIKALPAIAPARPIGKILPNLKGTYFYAKGTGKRMRDPLAVPWRTVPSYACAMTAPLTR